MRVPETLVAFSFVIMSLVSPSMAKAAASDSDLKLGLKGCWDLILTGDLKERQKDSNWYFSHQRCFDGKLFGGTKWSTCDGYIEFDCWSDVGTYGVFSGRLTLRDSDGGRESCHIEIFDKTLALSDCIRSQAEDGKWIFRNSDDYSFERQTRR